MMLTTLRSTAPTVSARCTRRVCDMGPVSTNDTPGVWVTSFSTLPLIRTTSREMNLRRIATTSHATSRMTTTRIGFDSASVISAACWLPVMR